MKFEYNDLLKANGDVFYVTIPKEESKKHSLKKKDAVKVTIEILGGKEEWAMELYTK